MRISSSRARHAAATHRAAAIACALGALGALQACSSGPQPVAEVGSAAYALMPAAGQDPNARRDYQIGPLDVLTISVFQEEDLSLEEVPVDASGSIIFPLIGQITVAGLSSAEVSKLIAEKLGERFLVNPQVSVLIKTSVSQKVTVDGEVKEAGVYPLQGDTSLLQAVAMAKGVSAVAKVEQVVVFRTIGNTRYAAMFDLGAIQSGSAADPQIRADDIVIVGTSGRKVFMRNLLAIAPTLTTGFVAIQQIAR
ncbi:polysaccharide biosynthesis/export family protein [Sphingomonas qomolangmaensis]|uniref:Polysaccharide export protein n=1 Tax=Sphingomonas qomolangmaensis TaxID=2918765 RepID=A0ABY5L8P1_9SPHN|nr:polysaccharide biosynthesis/export family protein [Sphingomonas qomolangmaensis]UUL82174.1 polysaccharide export protein [Sphingomonas qomolangmaensis]